MKASSASRILIALLSLVSVFHLLILLRIVPYGAVWAGRLRTVSEMYVFESVSLALNVFLLLVVVQKARLSRGFLPRKALNPVLYAFASLFFLNTIGNLFAAHFLEKTLGAALTLLLSYLCWQLARQRNIISTLR